MPTSGRELNLVNVTEVHGGPSPRVVGALEAVAFVFGAVVVGSELR